MIHFEHTSYLVGCVNTTSSAKPEVYNITLSSKEDRATATGSTYRKFTEDFVKLVRVVYEMHMRSDRYTDTFIAILRTGGKVIRKPTAE